MPKKSLNKFITNHTQGYGILFLFPDFKSGLTEKTTGKVLPAPNATIRKLLSHFTGDWVIKSHKVRAQEVILELQTEANSITHASKSKITNPSSAYRDCYQVSYSMSDHITLAKALGIF